MGYFTSTLFFCIVVILPSLYEGGKRPPWRPLSKKPKPTLLPPIGKDPEFYRKLREEIPSKAETAKKVIKNIFRIRSRGKRSVDLEDVIVVMDGSGSIGKCEFDNGRKAMKSFMEFVQPKIDAKYAMVTFSDNARTDYGFFPQLTAAKKIDRVAYPGGSTNTQAGLAQALNLFVSGGSGLSRKIVLLLTDGKSNVESQKTIPNAQKLKDKGVELFVIAVGNRHMSGIDEMAQVASYPPAEYLLRVEKVGDFLEVVNLAIQQAAPGKYTILKKYVSSC